MKNITKMGITLTAALILIGYGLYLIWQPLIYLWFGTWFLIS